MSAGVLVIYEVLCWMLAGAAFSTYLMHVASEELVVPLQPLHEFLRRDDTCFLLGSHDLR